MKTNDKLIIQLHAVSKSKHLVHRKGEEDLEFVHSLKLENVGFHSLQEVSSMTSFMQRCSLYYVYLVFQQH